jgi:hypothetical protein
LISPGDIDTHEENPEIYMMSSMLAQNILRIRVMVFNATFNNISAISWQLILLVEITGVPGENHRPY